MKLLKRKNGINFIDICKNITGGGRFKTKSLIRKASPITLAVLQLNGDENKIKEYMQSIYDKRPMNNLGIDLHYNTVIEEEQSEFTKEEKEKRDHKATYYKRTFTTITEGVKIRDLKRKINLKKLNEYIKDIGGLKGERIYLEELCDSIVSKNDIREIKRYAKWEEKVLGAEVLKDKKILGLLPARKKKIKNAPKTFESKSSGKESTNEKRKEWSESKRVKPKPKPKTKTSKYKDMGYVNNPIDDKKERDDDEAVL